MRKAILPLFLIVIFALENTISLIFSERFAGNNLIMAPQILFMTLMFVAVFVDSKRAVFYSFIFGLTYDISYTGILGIYMFLFPSLSLFVSQAIKFTQSNIFTATFYTIISVALLEFVVYNINFFIKITNFTPSYYFEYRFLPTMVFNTIVILILAYPFKKYLERITAGLKAD